MKPLIRARVDTYALIEGYQLFYWYLKKIMHGEEPCIDGRIYSLVGRRLYINSYDDEDLLIFSPSGKDEKGYFKELQLFEVYKTLPSIIGDYLEELYPRRK